MSPARSSWISSTASGTDLEEHNNGNNGNPFVDFCCLVRVGSLLAEALTKEELSRNVLSCWFALDNLCDKGVPSHGVPWEKASTAPGGALVAHVYEVHVWGKVLASHVRPRNLEDAGVGPCLERCQQLRALTASSSSGDVRSGLFFLFKKMHRSMTTKILSDVTRKKI